MDDMQKYLEHLGVDEVRAARIARRKRQEEAARNERIARRQERIIQATGWAVTVLACLAVGWFIVWLGRTI